MSGPPPPPPSSRGTPASSSSASASASNQDSRWKKWGKTAFDKSIVVSDWASGYANSASAKLGGERFWPKSNDFPEEIAKCERILRSFTVEGIETKPDDSKSSTPSRNSISSEDAEEDQAEKSKNKENFMTKKRKVLRKIPPAVIKRAKGILIYTGMRSGIAPLGGAGGTGLMFARLPDGSWSAPSCISPQNFAVGLLLGFDIFDVVLIVNTERALQTFMSHKVTLGAETAVAAGPFGAGISGEMGIDRSPVFSYVRSRGLYGGVEAMAQAFLHRFDENERVYYWPGITPRDIFEGKVRKPPIVEPLYRALRDAESGIAQGDSLERTVYEQVLAPPNVAVRQLQQQDSAELLQDGERLKLPPTPEELEAMEQAGIPDEFDLELERKAKEEAELRAAEEKKAIMALPPPPKHKNVERYWGSRGAIPGGKRRVAPLAPSPLHNEAAPKGPAEVEAEMEVIDLTDSGAEKPALPPRRGPEAEVDKLADELDRTVLDRDALQDARNAEVDLPAYEAGEAPIPLDTEGKSTSNSSASAVALPAGVLDRSDSAAFVPLLVSEPVTESSEASPSTPSTPKSTVPAELTEQDDSLSRSTSLTRPSRPPRRTPPNEATTTSPTTPASSTTTTSAEPSLRLFLDWDETITTSDTLSLIAPPEGTQLHGPSFSHYTDAYLSDMGAFESAFGDKDTWEKQLEFLSRIDEVEVASVARVEQGGLFKGMAKADLLQRAESEVEFRHGWDVFCSWLGEQVREGKARADVISVGWSGEFIRHAIGHRSDQAQAGELIKVYANEVEMAADDIGTGKLTKSAPLSLLDLDEPVRGGIRTGMHKLDIMHALAPTTSTTVYVGDSSTDLPCLVNAHYGLLIKPSDQFEQSSINQTLQRVHPPISKLYKHHDEFVKQHSVQESKDKQRNGGVLIRVDDWEQALEVIKKIQELHTSS